MLENNKWVITTVLSIIAIIIPITIYMISQPNHSLTYEIISKSELVGDNSIQGLEIKIKGKLIKSANIYSIVIANNGSQPIRKVDFEKELSINFDNNIYSVKIINKTPENLSIRHEIVGNSIEISPFLFNQGDKFGVEIISSSSINPVIDARIAMIKTIEIVSPDDKEGLKRVFIFSICFLWMISYGRLFMNSTSLSTGFSSITIIKVSDFVLAISLLVASSVLMKTIIDFDHNRVFIYSGGIIAACIGLYISKREREYNIGTELNS
jgi:hypothetical protein